MDFIWIGVAFVCGFFVRQWGFPPLVGYLCAGFGLNAVGVQPFVGLQSLADLGITLMLFTIGLKLNLKDLARPEVWGSSLSHTCLWCVLIVGAGLIFLLSQFSDLSWQSIALFAFALSFSSTVCVMKILEDNAELKTRHGDLAIGILVIQDIVAVIFLVLAAGKTPSLWSLLLPLVWFARPAISQLLNRSGHGELLVLVGFFLALGGAELFELVKLKGDLGALVCGMFVAGLPKANEIYKALMSFKDLFLIGFFLSIGFTALPSLELLGYALLLVVLLPIKFILFFAVFSAFQLRARTAFLTSLALSNFSEFGLIVASISVAKEWLPQEDLVIIAIAVALSFVISTLLYNNAHAFYARYKHWVCRFERTKAKQRSAYEQPGDAAVLIVGMGRVGSGAYRALEHQLDRSVWGVEADQERVIRQRKAGYQVVLGDADDIDFWEHLDLSNVTLIMLAIPSVNEMKNILYQLQQAHFGGKIAAVARYEDERKELVELGADVAFNYYAEVGAGFAEECFHLLEQERSVHAVP
ncbi:cation:proton antiporter family protein [Marinibactrum halimedae]|uniref:Potassium transporter Kef n=1 Tax=Marinibactrum halimedae TaxID=1444977 RepID=A0AA37WQ87_9GAMM|nr:cation:proton antiporter family protein [Marinibactrum halimedae]MCD9458969.1 cation:proton antiporter [Marinibactrum halimedae]GLS26902.1 potassium transporter Kef [Marinibactrum halimedae]